MSLLGKWFGFGRDEIFDEGVRAHDRGDYESAIDAFEEALRHTMDPSIQRLARTHLADSYTRLAEQLANSKKWAQAADILKKAVDLCPNYPDFHLKLARVYGECGRPDEEAAALAEALSLNPNYTLAILYQAHRWYASGMHDEALGEAARAVSIDSEFGDLRYQSFLEHHSAGNRDDAAEALEALALDSFGNAEVHHRLGESYARDRMFDEAAASYARAIQIAPNFADLHCKYGQVLLAQDKLEEAREHFERAVALNPTYVEAHAQLGIALKRLRKDKEARQSFRRAYELNPAHEIAAMEMARLL